MNKKTSHLFSGLAIGTLLAIAPLSYSACDSTIPLTTPREHFTNNRDGTVTDNTTGLMWTYCLYQQYGYDCAGDGNGWTGDWDTALSEVVNANYGYFGYSDWRIPNVKELASIMEASCDAPALNPGVFLAFSSGIAPTWTSSADVHNAQNAWVVDFTLGGEALSVDRTATSAHLRLVRDANNKNVSIP